MPKFKRQIVIFTLLICMCMQASAISYPQSLTPISLQLKYTHQFQFAGYYAAKELGYYADEGLDVEFREWDQEKRVVDQVVSGEADFGIGDPTLLSEFVNGQPIVALAAIFQESPLAFFSKKTSGILSPKDFIGKIVMFNSKGVGADVAAMLSKQGISPSQFTYLEHTNDYQSLIDGKVDVLSGYLTDSPYFYEQNQTPINTILLSTYDINFYGDILFTSQKKLKQSPEVVAKFKRATLKGWQYAVTHIGEVTTLIKTQYKPSLSQDELIFEAQETIKLMHYPIIEVGHMNQQRWTHIADVFKQQGMIKKEVDFDRFVYMPTKESYLLLFLKVLAITLFIVSFSFYFISKNRLLKQKVSVAEERERLMRDMHDGVGGHLVSLLASLDSESETSPVYIKQSIKECLSDLRIVILSLEASSRDLETLLGMFRHNIQPKITASGLELKWNIGDLGQIPELSSKSALNILRILQESVTNIIKHSGATIIELSAEQTTINAEPFIVIKVIDNGSGKLDNGNRNGHGIKNMKNRAKELKGDLDIQMGEGKSQVILTFPV